ncbi:UPF0462 protein C4orf33 homolog isoform X13 [Gopherus flavomarginatus]|uniref:UPF0462 protein C4orf33 homolog isoform X13 n=1 Tax=Gopherus flavomarginatus TaxID=286002 RepID=UPI0021CBF8DB|nr:UPF0462 protein C4orf33 homolog isoform X13 [Gopherus flavomarginatus]
MEFKIEHTWDSLPVSHEPVSVRLKSGSAGLLMEVSAPFFNDPPAPLGEPGKPFSGLWDYEVVEAFFLSERTKQYLEVELCPRNVFTNNHQTKSLEGKRSELEYKITNTWDSIKVMREPAIIRFKAGDKGLIMEVNSLFFDDPSAPSGEPGKPFDGLWDYEGMDNIFYYCSLEETVLKIA